MTKSVNSRPSKSKPLVDESRASTSPSKWLTHPPSFLPDHQLIQQEEIGNQLAVNLQFAQEPVLLKGMEGSGKRCLVQQYIQRYQAQFQHIIWINCSHNIGEDIVRNEILLQHLGLQFASDVPLRARFRIMMRELRLLEGSKLMVLANFNKKYADLRLLKLLPKGEDWQVLITSRHELPNCKMMEMPLMNEADASQLFYQHYQAPLSAADVGKIVNELEYHPLTISIAARYAAHQHLNTQTLLDELEQIIQDLAPVNFSISKRVYYKTFQRAFAFIAGFLPEEEKELTVKALQTLAVLPPVAFPFHQVQELLDLSKDHTREVMENLEDAGLLLHQKKQDTFQMHPLINMIVVHRQRPKVEDLKQAIFYFGQQLKKNDPRRVSLLNSSFSLLFNLYQKDVSVANLQHQVALGYQELGVLDKASKLLGLALETLEEKKDKRQSAWRNNLALIEQQAGNAQTAMSLLLKTMRADVEQYGAMHPLTTSTQSNLALVYRDLKDYKKSTTLLERVYEVDRQQLPANHEKCAINSLNLATLYLDQGETEKVMPLLETILAEPTSSLLFCNTARLVALCYAQKGEAAQAIYWMQEVLQKNKARLGRLHPQVATDESNLAYFYQLKGDNNTAHDLLANALKSDILHFGKQSLVTASRYLQIAYLYVQMDNWDKAKESLLYCYKIRKLLLGEDAEETLAVKELLF